MRPENTGAEPRVYWLLGLPFDLVDMDRAMRSISHAVAAGQQTVIATPNVNFLALASRREAFRQNVLRADLSLVDGMPLVWLGRLVGIRFPERVSGSSLVERMLSGNDDFPIRLFFFGGEADVAEMACRRVNSRASGAVAVGAINPGFGSIEELSRPEILERINSAAADFVIVALGAEKGHAWIERNRNRLNARVISHLGATINFVAGTVRRAPPMLRKLGLEWLWRIREEPRLVSRYWWDGIFLLRALLVNVIPILIRRIGNSLGATEDFESVVSSDDPTKIVFRGRFLESAIPKAIRSVTGQAQGEAETIRIDLSGVTALDCGSIGYLYALRFRRRASPRIELVGSGRKLASLLRVHRAWPLVELAAE